MLNFWGIPEENQKNAFEKTPAVLIFYFFEVLLKYKI